MQVQIYEYGIELHTRNVFHAEKAGRGNVPTTTDPDDCRLVNAGQTIGEVDQIDIAGRKSSSLYRRNGTCTCPPSRQY